MKAVSEFFSNNKLTSIVGFRVAPRMTSMSARDFRKILDKVDPSRSLKIVHLQRRDIINSTVSLVRAKKLHKYCPEALLSSPAGKWNLLSTTNCTTPSIFFEEVDFKRSLSSLIEQKSYDEDFCNAQMRPRYNVYYEDMMSDLPATLSNVVHFLRGSEIKVVLNRSQFKKITPGRIEDAALNHDEVVRWAEEVMGVRVWQKV